MREVVSTQQLPTYGSREILPRSGVTTRKLRACGPLGAPPDKVSPVEWGVEWSGVEWSGVEWSGASGAVLLSEPGCR